VLASDAEGSIQTLRDLKALGLQIAIDATRRCSTCAASRSTA
jgi:hypothetical protein